MKKLLLILTIFIGFHAASQCNDDVSICTPGVAGPFNFINTPGPPTDYANPVGCGTGVGTPITEFAFITLYITADGNLDLLIDGDGGAGSGYLDVVVYNIPQGVAPCVAVMNDANEIGCNYADFEDGCVQFGNAPNINCNSTVPGPAVSAGDQIMIIVNNYGPLFGLGNGSNNFTLELGNAGTSAQTGPADATINAAGPILETDPPIVMTAATGGGTWSATCGACIDPVTGAFDPSVSGVGDFDICYTAGAAPCDDNDCYTITVNPDCSVFINSINQNLPNCSATEDITGTVDIISGFPATGDLIVEDCHGNQDIVASAPFAAGTYNYSLTSPADGNPCSLTAYYSDQAACNNVLNYNSQLGSTGNEAGTFTPGHNGDGTNVPTPATNQYVLCDQDLFTLTHNDDFDIADISAGTLDPTDGYAPGILYMVYSCQPAPGGPGVNPFNDPCYLGFFNGGDDIILINDGGSADPALGAALNGSNSYFIVPISSYDVNGPWIQTDCYDLSMADMYEIQYLNPITYTFTEDCQAGTATITINGGYPEFYPGEEFTGNNLSHGNFTDNTAEHGQSMTISGLSGGDDYSFDVVDQNGCPITISPAGVFPPLLDAAFVYATDVYCSTDVDPTAIGITNPGGTYTSIQGGISLNAGNGTIDLSTSTGGTYDIVYSTQPLDGVCFDTDTFTVTINITPIVNDLADQTVCNGYILPAITGTNLTGNEAYYDGIGGTGSVIAAGTNITTTQQIYIYDETGTVPNCFSEEDFMVTINPTPDVDDIVDGTVCDTYNLPAVITGTDLTGNEGFYTLSGGAGVQLAPGSAITTSQTIYIYDATAAPICTDEESFTITVNSSVNAGMDNNATMCNAIGNTMNLGTDLLDPTADAGGVWSETTASGQFNTGSSVFDAGGLGNGTYNFIYVLVTPAPCVNDTAYFTINVTGTIDAGADNNATYCNDEINALDLNTMLTAGVTGGIWAETSGTPSGQFTTGTGMLNMMGLSNGTYTFQYTIPANGPCAGDDALISITINEQPQIDHILDITQCDSYNLPVITGTSLTPGVVFRDQGNGAGNIIANGAQITSTQTIYIYDETGTVPNCFDADTFTVTINLTPDITDVLDETICDSYIIPAIAGTNLSGAVSYYTGAAGTGVALSPGDLITSSQTIYIYDETNSTPNCFDEEDFTITINETPDVSDHSDTNVCNDYVLPIISGTNLTGNESYFDAPNGGGIAYSAGDLVNTSGTFYLYDETSSTPNCFDEESFTLTVNTSITAGADNDTEICFDGGIVDILALLDPTADAGGTWSETTASGQFNTGNQEFNVTNILDGIYTFEYEVNGVAPCLSDIAEFTVTVHPLPTIVAGNDFTICEGGQAILTGSGAPNLSWDNGVVDGVFFNPVQTLTYTLTGTDLNGCQDTDQVDVIIEDTPDATFTADVLSGCAPLDVNFSMNINPPNGSSGHWVFGDNSTSFDLGNTSHTFNSPGCFDVSYTLTTALGCSETVTYIDYICVDEVPVAEFTFSPTNSTILDPLVNFTNLSQNSSNYIWNFGDGTASSTEENPIHTFPGDTFGTYTVWLVAYGNNQDCVDSVSRSVQILDEVIYHVPNTFTPDQDDYNEVFQPVFESGFDPYNFEMLIYNRWGEILFETHDASKGWDGKYGGDIVQDGTYIWKINFKETTSDKRHTDQGHVNVIR